MDIIKLVLSGLRGKMNTNRKNFKFGILATLTAFFISAIMPGLQTEARADKGAAFLGGMVAGHIVGGAVRRIQ